MNEIIPSKKEFKAYASGLNIMKKQVYITLV